jgi:hypothetical protein
MGGRFGKYGDAKRKAKNLKTRLMPPALQQRRKGNRVKGSDKSGARGAVYRKSSNKTEDSGENASG